MKKYITKLHYKKDVSFTDNFVLAALSFGSIFYSLAVRLRNFLYKKQFLKSKSLPAYVISIGNLTTGGTGKTPITSAIAKYLKDNLNKNVAILSHGYGGELSTSETNIVSDGKNIFFKADFAGDEPYWMASNLKDIPVITGRNRYLSGEVAIQDYSCDFLILDDGFQHIKLKRDFNILVIDCYKQFGNNKLLPAGPLREPLSEISRADKIIVVNKKPFDEVQKCNCLEYVNELESMYNKPTYLCNFETKRIYNIRTQQELDPAEDCKVYAFAGIAQPEFFFQSLSKAFSIVKTREYADHHLYSKNDLEYIIKEAQKNNANVIITTEKDAVKLSALVESAKLPIEIYALKLGISLDIANLFEHQLDSEEIA